MVLEKNAVTPQDLSKVLGVSDKTIRAWLRVAYPRPEIEKRTRWILTDGQAEAVRRRFSNP